MGHPLTVLCLASYEKGHEFLREAKRQGCRVLLLTSLSLKNKAQWPVECIDEIYYMPDENHKWNEPDTRHAVCHLARTQTIDRLVPLDDFDLEPAANLREHLRIPGMGETTTRYFRDKLAMRMKAQEHGLNIPEFVHVLNNQRIHEFTECVPPPWVLKPRFLAGAIGIRKVVSAGDLWALIDSLGDQQSYYLAERYVPGDICHVDSIVNDSQVLFSIASRYGAPPMDVSHQGGIFTTRILERGSPLEQSLTGKNAKVLEALGLVRGVSHTEFIAGREDGKLYFLETSARVGGAHIAELVEAATGLNMWAEWAKIEIAGGKAPYSVGPHREEYAGLIVSLAKQAEPDTSGYVDPEVAWRMKREHHVGFILRSPSYARITVLLENYVERIRNDFYAYLPPPEKPTN
jgi:hypothetical protein